MTDKELLERAAKAAGIELRFLTGITPFSDGPEFVGIWNPLTDDGDALRLAVKLGMDVCVDTKHEERFTHVICFSNDYDFAIVDEMESHNNDPYAATRRAITLAAAEIGKEMINKD